MADDDVGRRRSAGMRRTIRPGRLIGLLTAGVVIAAAIVSGTTTAGKHMLKGLLLGMAGQTLQVVHHQPVVDPQRYHADVPFTMLVMGTEATSGYNGPNLTDSMMVVGYDPKAGQVGILSVPRDLWLNIPGQGYRRINSVYENESPKMAPLTVELAVEQYIGVPIEYWAMVNYQSFTSLVNDLRCNGQPGVQVDVPYAIYDPHYPNATETANTLFQLSAGQQCLNGTTALKFIRERHAFAALGDIQRSVDQQVMLLALKKALLQPSTLPRLGSIASDIFNLVSTNFPESQLPTLADQVVHLPSSAISHSALGYPESYCQANGINEPSACNGGVTNYTTSGGADVLLPHTAAIHAVVRQSFPAVLQHMQDAPIQVYNGTNRTGLAGYYSTVLQGMGATTEPPGNAPLSAAGYPVNEVFVNNRVLGHTPALADILGASLGAKVRTAAFPQTKAGVVIILGKNFPSIGNQAGSGS